MRSIRRIPYIILALMMALFSACRETTVAPTPHAGTQPMFSLPSSSSLVLYGTDAGTDALVIDIKPDSDVNPINPTSRGVIPVAILGSDFFDVTTVDQSTLAFGPDGAPIAHKKSHFADVNDDGLTDLLAHFRTQETGIAAGDTEACLSGETFDGTMFEACDSVGTVPAGTSDGALSGGRP